ncbi:hypothetical protein, partial [Acinetobacter baumannii]|uniref:hypothetical protein n=1 Tax=Acinetobacter baumannii TaxID=470 RepID=UPI001BB466CE
QQQAISSAVFAVLGASIAQYHTLQDWLGSGASRRATQSVASVGKGGAVRPAVQIEQGSV